jgi:hypothetical protein
MAGREDTEGDEQVIVTLIPSQDGRIPAGEVTQAIQKLGVDPEKPDPLWK